MKFLLHLHRNRCPAFTQCPRCDYSMSDRSVISLMMLCTAHAIRLHDMRADDVRFRMSYKVQ